MLTGKQAEICRFGDSDYSALICDGAIRSGKTMIMIVAFVEWAMQHFNSANFAICGKTVQSARRNIVQPFKSLSYIRRRFAITDSRSSNMLVIKARRGGAEITNNFYIFGGRDESSQDLIQGITLAGVMLDEVALMPESFVNQATARCSVAGSKYWFNCNPAGPEHWFKRNWIDHAGERNTLHLHFTLYDNPSLSADILTRYEQMYTGVFYRRYILGEWARAEGLVYPMFDRGANVMPEIPHSASDVFYISIDYGTVNPFSAGLWRVNPITHKAYREAEYYFDSRREARQQTDEEYYAHLERLAADYPIRRVIIDPSAASFIECIRRHGRFAVRPADNDVLSGIRTTASLLGCGRLLFSAGCRDTIREFGLYSWDDKAPDDRVIKANDHTMDDIRYFCYTVLKREFKWTEWR